MEIDTFCSYFFYVFFMLLILNSLVSVEFTILLVFYIQISIQFPAGLFFVFFFWTFGDFTYGNVCECRLFVMRATSLPLIRLVTIRAGHLSLEKAAQRQYNLSFHAPNLQNR